jgi:hypothetical protein
MTMPWMEWVEPITDDELANLDAARLAAGNWQLKAAGVLEAVYISTLHNAYPALRKRLADAEASRERAIAFAVRFEHEAEVAQQSGRHGMHRVWNT